MFGKELSADAGPVIVTVLPDTVAPKSVTAGALMADAIDFARLEVLLVVPHRLRKSWWPSLPHERSTPFTVMLLTVVVPLPLTVIVAV